MYLSATLNGSNVSVVDIKNVGATQYVTYVDTFGNLSVYRGLISNIGSVLTSGISIVNQGTSGSFPGGVSSVGLTSNTLTISNSPITSSGNISVNLSLFGISGTFFKVSSDPYGRVISGTTLVSADIPVLPYDSTSASILWSRLSGTPTTLSGYGITSTDTMFDKKYLTSAAYLPLSGGTLSGPGNLNVFGNLSVSGNIYLGNLTITSGNISPNAANTGSIGQTALPYNIMYSVNYNSPNGFNCSIGSGNSSGNITIASSLVGGALSIGGAAQTSPTVIHGGSTTVAAPLSIIASTNDLLYVSGSSYDITLPTTFISKKEQTITNASAYNVIVPSSVTVYGNGTSYTNTSINILPNQIVKLVQISSTTWYISQSTVVGNYNIILSATTLSALPTSGISIGTQAFLPRLCGHGIFWLCWNGTRYEVLPGQSIISDPGGLFTSGYQTTGTGAQVNLVTYVIPGGLIGDGEEWFSTMQQKIVTFVSGSNNMNASIGSQQISNTGNNVTVGQAAQAGTHFSHRGNQLVTQQSITYPGTGGVTVSSVDLSQPQNYVAGVNSGIGNVTLLYFCGLGRFA